MQALWLKYGLQAAADTTADIVAGTACASRDGFKTGNSFARCEADSEADTADAGDGSGSEDRFRTERSFLHGERNETTADAHYTAQDVMREALRLAAARANQDEASRDVVIDRHSLPIRTGS